MKIIDYLCHSILVTFRFLSLLLLLLWNNILFYVTSVYNKKRHANDELKCRWDAIHPWNPLPYFTSFFIPCVIMDLMCLYRYRILPNTLDDAIFYFFFSCWGKSAIEHMKLRNNNKKKIFLYESHLEKNWSINQRANKKKRIQRERGSKYKIPDLTPSRIEKKWFFLVCGFEKKNCVVHRWIYRKFSDIFFLLFGFIFFYLRNLNLIYFFILQFSIWKKRNKTYKNQYGWKTNLQIMHLYLAFSFYARSVLHDTLFLRLGKRDKGF